MSYPKVARSRTGQVLRLKYIYVACLRLLLTGVVGAWNFRNVFAGGRRSSHVLEFRLLIVFAARLVNTFGSCQMLNVRMLGFCQFSAVKYGLRKNNIVIISQHSFHMVRKGRNVNCSDVINHRVSAEYIYMNTYIKWKALDNLILNR
jgi:hypothetical protein